MIRALYTAASGMVAQELNLDNVANNLANSSTAGFRSRRLQFEDLIYQNLIMPGAAASQQTTVVAGLQVGLGTRSAASEVIQTQGRLYPDRQPARFDHPGSGLFSSVVARRADGLYPLGQLPYRRIRQSRHSGRKPGAACHRHSTGRNSRSRSLRTAPSA